MEGRWLEISSHGMTCALLPPLAKQVLVSFQTQIVTRHANLEHTLTHLHTPLLSANSLGKHPDIRNSLRDGFQKTKKDKTKNNLSVCHVSTAVETPQSLLGYF